MKKIFCILCITIMLAVSGCASNTAAGGTLAEAVSLMDARQFDDAIEKLDQALKDGNDPRNVLRLKGITQMRQGDHEAAVATFSEALSHSGPVAGSMDYDINLYLADCLRSLDRNEEAVKVYGNILALKENDTETLFLRGETLLKMSDVEHARAVFDRVIKIAPRDFDMRVRIYRAYEAYNLTEDMGMAVLSDALTSYGDAACAKTGISTAVQDYHDWILSKAPEVASQFVEVCGNGIDDDGNGLVDDCADADDDIPADE